MGFVVMSPVFADTGTSLLSSSCSKAICASSPKEFSLLLTLCRDLLQSIKTMGTTSPYLGKYVHPNRFQWDAFMPPEQNVLDKTLSSVDQALDFSVATTAIFSSPQQFGWAKDVLAWILVLFKNEVFLRDMRLLEDVQATLSQKKYELGLAGGWFSSINEPNRKQLQSILDSYIKKGLLSQWSFIKEGTLYNHITSLVGGILSATQSFLYLDKDVETDPLASLSTRSWVKWQGNTLQVVFSSWALHAMDAQYACAQWTTNICSKENSVLSSGISLFTSFASSQKDAGLSAWKKIKDASKRLTQVFSARPSDEFKNREKELLTSYYGNQAYAEKRWTSLTWFLSSLVSVSTENSSSPLKDMKFDPKGAYISLKDMFNHRRKIALDQQNLSKDSVAVVKEGMQEAWLLSDASSFEGSISLGLQDMLSFQEADFLSVSLSDVKDFTAIFAILGKQIHAINDLIGTKDDWLLQTLSTCADLQCSQ